jgi:hypothetical protein
MLKGKYVLLSLAAALVCWQVAGVDTVNSGIVDPCLSTVTTNAGNDGVVLVCPLGDGDPLNAAVPNDGIAYGVNTFTPVNCQITLTVRDNANVAIPGIPAVDMWLVGCNDGLLLCGGSSGSNADNATSDPAGTTTFTNEPIAGGCDTGLYVVVQGVVIENPGACTPKCLPIVARSPDYKSVTAPPGCTGDIACPDSRVTLADFSWWNTHFKSAGNPGAVYHACADYAHPIGASTTPAAPNPFVISLSDYSKFSVHYAGAGHKCPI